MIMKKLHNPSNKNIVSFPIEEAQFDVDGNVKVDHMGVYLKTGRSLEWSLMAGETLTFPEYVANYLKQIYGFLTEVGQDGTPVETVTVAPSEATQTVNTVETTTITVDDKEPVKLVCRGCGKSFRGPKALALHLAARHEELL